MKKTMLAATAVLAAAAANPAAAQVPNITPFSVEVRGGLALPTGDFGEGIDTGFTVGANATYHLLPLIGIYGGYTYNEFDVGNSDFKVKDQGFSAGVRLAVPTPLIPIDPYVKAGAVFNQLERPTLTGVGDEKSDRKTGFEVGAGVGIGLGPKLSFTPQVTYTKYNSDFSALGTTSDEVSHIRVDVGLRLRL
jgi:opacity protein-like surface antigen